jgi:cholesterol 7alpha-monooxygenase
MTWIASLPLQLDHVHPTTSLAIVAALAAAFGLHHVFFRPRRSKDGIVEPPYVHSFIPYVGSALEMGQDTRGFIRKYCNKYDTPIFSATVAGTKCHFIGDARFVTLVYENKPQIDSFALGSDFLKRVCGMTNEDLSNSYLHKELNKKSDALINNFILARSSLEQTVAVAQTELLELIAKFPVTKNEWTKFPMFQTVFENVYRATMKAMVSGYMADHGMDVFEDFDRGIPLIMAKVPPKFLPKAIKARDVLLSHLGSSSYLEQATQLMKERYELFKHVPDLLHKANIGLYWASVGNSVPTIFWTIFNVVTCPKAYQAIRNEVDSITAKVFTLEDLDKMVSVNSVFLESLRLYAGSFTPRDLIDDYVFDTKLPNQPKFLLKKGTRIMGYMPILHYDTELFPNPEQFVWDRFLPDPVTGKPKTFVLHGQMVEPVRVFGGGKHLCPGRKFITYENQAYIAHLFRNFDIRLCEGETRPSIDKTTQGVNVNKPDREVYMEMRLRQE